MSLLLQKILNTGDAVISIPSFKDTDGVIMPIATATEITLYLKNMRGDTLATYKYVGHGGDIGRIYADTSTAAHINILRAIKDEYVGKSLNLCGTWESVNAELPGGVGSYDFDLENITIAKCQ